MEVCSSVQSQTHWERQNSCKGHIFFRPKISPLLWQKKWVELFKMSPFSLPKNLQLSLKYVLGNCIFFFGLGSIYFSSNLEVDPQWPCCQSGHPPLHISTHNHTEPRRFISAVASACHTASRCQAGWTKVSFSRRSKLTLQLWELVLWHKLWNKQRQLWVISSWALELLNTTIYSADLDQGL